MLVILKSDAELKSVKVYSVNVKNRAVINATFDKMYQDDKMT